MAVLRAAACGLAIAGTTVGILPELAQRGTVITASGFDADALAGAIRRAVAQRKELGCRVREMGEREFLSARLAFAGEICILPQKFDIR